MADPQVQIIAQPSGDSLHAPSTNAALQLAGSLADTSETMGPVLQDIGKQFKAKDEAAAQQAAAKSSGKAFGDAVRNGDILPTQSQWFMQAYEKQAAQIRAQGDIAKLAADSNSWAEKADPTGVAFAQRWSREVGTIQGNYTGIDQAAGFKAAADPLSQQVLQQNEQQNVARVIQERQQNTSILTTQAIRSAQAALPLGGSVTPDSLDAATKAQHDDWVAHGGTEQSWRRLQIGAVINAAEDTANPTLLDVLKDDRGGKGALADMVDANGQSVQEDISQAQYRITRAAEQAGTLQMRQAQQAAKATVGKIMPGFWADPAAGGALIPGAGKAPLSPADLGIWLDKQQVDGKPLSPLEKAQFFKELEPELASINGVSSNLIKAQSDSPTAAAKILDLHYQARTEGWSPHLQQNLEDSVIRGQIPLSEAIGVQNTAQSQSQHLDTEARTDARQAKSDARADKREARQSSLQEAQDTRTLITNATRQVMDLDHSRGTSGVNYEKNPKLRAQLLQRAEDAAGSTFLKTGDQLAARAAAEQAIVDFDKAQVARRQVASKGATPGSGSSSLGGAK